MIMQSILIFGAIAVAIVLSDLIEPSQAYEGP
jgi:hypothetical protein